MRHLVVEGGGRWLAAALASVGLVLSVARPARALVPSFDLQVSQPPTPIDIEGRTYLAYELHVTSFARGELELTGLEVVDAERGGAPLARLEGTDLDGALGRPGLAAGSPDRRRMAPGTCAVVYLWFALENRAQPPRSIDHRLEFLVSRADDRETDWVKGGRAEVRALPPVVLDPPLGGGPWVAVYDPKMERGHRRMLYALDGRVRIPGRFAIDWMRLGEDGKLAHDDESKVENWYGYGADVLAVADARVTDIRDGIAESATLEGNGAGTHALEDASGNYVVLDLGHGRYAFYEHLKPGSVRVRPGDRVRSGQVIAALGFTGDSTGPHLHFHVADAKSTLLAEGLPYVLRGFDRLGAFASIEAFGKGEAWKQAPPATARRTRELPAVESVVRFPAAAGRQAR